MDVTRLSLLLLVLGHEGKESSGHIKIPLKQGQTSDKNGEIFTCEPKN